MGDRPILFSAEMVRAILDGRKTQTRRVMKVQPWPDALVTVEHYHETVIDRHGDMQPGKEIFGAHWDDGEYGLRCPYGAPGDTLWVRESLYIWGRWRKDGLRKNGLPSWRFEEVGQRADPDPDLGLIGSAHVRHLLKFWLRPSIHMPRWASRITLRITDVLVERLHEITEDDALAEGVTPLDYAAHHVAARCGARIAFEQLWNTINGPGAWEANPWVWVISFEKVMP
ncbi:MAG: hypothetical protein ING00_17930 [Roseomonas sp.]|nr:hypothetical protein [Roseomonas sp.]